MEVWSAVGKTGKDTATIVRYNKAYPKHLQMFETHMSMLLNVMGKSVNVARVAGAYATSDSVCMVMQVCDMLRMYVCMYVCMCLVTCCVCVFVCVCVCALCVWLR